MTHNLRLQPIVLAAAGALLALALAASPVSAQGLGQAAKARASGGAGGAGWDVSWPQCGVSLPRSGAFGIVGVTGGRPWSANPCLAAEYSWAQKLAASPGFYMNTANPAPHSSYYWPASGTSSPALCADATSVADPGCAYDYGWHAAANAMNTAASALAAAGLDQTAAASHSWWLDVETGNTWNGTASANAADVQGSLDYLRSNGVPVVGVYSTGYQWGSITGGYTTANASRYAAGWRPEFTSAYGIGNAPDWVAGAGNARSAATYCSRSFTGVAVQLSQYPSAGFDANYRCH